MYYSVVEQHVDGSWWYHRKTFETKEEALEYAQGALGWRDSRQIVFEHSTKLPDETLWTRNFQDFYWAGSSTLIAGHSDIVEIVADITKKGREEFKKQPKVDLEKKIDDYFALWRQGASDEGCFNANSQLVSIYDCYRIAHHFYELGLNARKEE